MLEILYDFETLRIRSWCANPSQFNNFTPDETQALIILPIDPPEFPADYYLLELENGLILPNPDYTPPVNETDTLRAQEILATSPAVITMPEMWELMRIYARRLGFPV